MLWRPQRPEARVGARAWQGASACTHAPLLPLQALPQARNNATVAGHCRAGEMSWSAGVCLADGLPEACRPAGQACQLAEGGGVVGNAQRAQQGQAARGV